MSNQKQADGSQHLPANSSIAAADPAHPTQAMPSVAAPTIQMNQLLRRNLNSHDIQKHSNVNSSSKSPAPPTNPIDNSGTAVIYDGALQQIAAENASKMSKKQQNSSLQDPAGSGAYNQNKWPAQNQQSLVSLLNGNYGGGNYHDGKPKKPLYYRNSLNTRVYHNTNQLANRLQGEDAIEVQNILKIGAIHPPPNSHKKQPYLSVKEPQVPGNLRIVNRLGGGGTVAQNTLDPKIAQKFITSEQREQAKYLQSMEPSNSLSQSGIHLVNTVKFPSGKQNNTMHHHNQQIATIIQKKSNKSICLPIIKSPKQQQADASEEQQDPMNTKHFDKLKHFADYSGSGLTEKSGAGQDQQVMRTHQSSNLLNHYINNKSAHPHLNSLKLPQGKMRPSQKTALEGSHSQMGHSGTINPKQQAQFGRSESTDYRLLNPPLHHGPHLHHHGGHHHLTANMIVGYSATSDHHHHRQPGFLTSKKIGIGQKIHSIEVTPSRLQQRRSPFAAGGGYHHESKLVTDDMLHIHQIQQNLPSNSAKRPEELNYQQVYNKKLSISQQGPYRNEIDSDQTPTKLKKQFNNHLYNKGTSSGIHSVGPPQTMPPHHHHKGGKQQQLLPSSHELVVNLGGGLVSGSANSEVDAEENTLYVQSLQFQQMQQQKWMMVAGQGEQQRQHNYKIKISKKSEPMQNVAKILENQQEQQQQNMSMLQLANSHLISENISQQPMAEQQVNTAGTVGGRPSKLFRRERSPDPQIMRTNQTKFQQYLINNQFEKRSSLMMKHPGGSGSGTGITAAQVADGYNSASGTDEKIRRGQQFAYFEQQLQDEYSQEEGESSAVAGRERDRSMPQGGNTMIEGLQESAEYEGKIIYKFDGKNSKCYDGANKQDNNTNQISTAVDGDISFSPDRQREQEEQNTQQMFYGDFQCDDDEPEEDDMSNQNFSNSQFSDNISAAGAEDGESEQGDADPESPMPTNLENLEKTKEGEDDEQEAAGEGVKEQVQQNESKVATKVTGADKKSKEQQKQVVSLGFEQQQQTNVKMTKEQVKFLDMLQNSKSQKNELQRTIHLTGRTPKLAQRGAKKKKHGHKKYTSQKSKKVQYHNEDEESNFDQDINYQSDSNQQTGSISTKDALPAQLKSLLLRKGEEKITEDMTVQEKYLNKPPNNKIVLNYGPIPGRYPSVFFNYPPFLKIQRPFKSDKIQVINQEQLEPYSYLSFKISDQTNTYNCVVNALKTAGFHLVLYGNGPTSFNILWSPLYKAGKLKSFNQYQKINHFPGSWTIGSKASLWRNVQKLRRKFGKDFEICPQTYIFPEDYKRWCNDREMNNFKDLYILKPVAASCGKGIRVVGKKDRVPQKNGYLVSKYLSRPHLLRGFKYDLRIYILVTSYEPLKAYIFREGLVRLATQPYSTTKGSLKKRYVHLTNYSINKNAENYAKNQQTDKTNINKTAKEKESTTTSSQKNETANNATQQPAEDEPVESKWSLKMLREEYDRIGIDYDEIFGKIKDLCVKTLISVETQIASNMRSIKQKNNCFEIYGFDVLIDRDYKPWLLEVNVGPSLSSSSPFDKQVKSILLSDSLHLSGFNVFDRKQMLISKKLERQSKLIRNLGQQQNNQQQQTSGESQLLQNMPPLHPLSKPPKPKTLRHRESPSKKTESPAVETHHHLMNKVSPKKPGDTDRNNQSDFDSITQHKVVNSPTNFGGDERSFHPSHRFKIKDKWAINSFLTGFEFLTEDDLDLLASFEEEQSRRQQTQFERIFPMRDNIDSLGKCFECQRHSNNLIWQYLRQKCPSQYLKAYFKSYPQI